MSTDFPNCESGEALPDQLLNIHLTTGNQIRQFELLEGPFDRGIAALAWLELRTPDGGEDQDDVSQLTEVANSKSVVDCQPVKVEVKFSTSTPRPDAVDEVEEVGDPDPCIMELDQLKSSLE